MNEKIKLVGSTTERIHVTGAGATRIEPEEVAALLGAEPVGKPFSSRLDPISLLELGKVMSKQRQILTLAFRRIRPACVENTSAFKAVAIPFQAAAKQAMTTVETRCFRADNGWELNLFPSNRHKDQHVVSFAQGRPRGVLTLFVSGKPIPWVKEVDEDGRGFLASSALNDILNGTADLVLQVEPLDGAIPVSA